MLNFILTYSVLWTQNLCQQHNHFVCFSLSPLLFKKCLVTLKKNLAAKGTEACAITASPGVVMFVKNSEVENHRPHPYQC